MDQEAMICAETLPPEPCVATNNPNEYCCPKQRVAPVLPPTFLLGCDKSFTGTSRPGDTWSVRFFGTTAVANSAATVTLIPLVKNAISVAASQQVLPAIGFPEQPLLFSPMYGGKAMNFVLPDSVIGLGQGAVTIETFELLTNETAPCALAKITTSIPDRFTTINKCVFLAIELGGAFSVDESGFHVGSQTASFANCN
jgi:hypothetical protein